MNVVVDNLLTNYVEVGSGPTVLLLHGWGDNCRTFAGLQKSLSGSYRTIAVDLPGFGQTQAPPDVWELDDYVTFINHFLKKMGISEVFGLVGHSNGGALAIRGLATRGLQTKKLILLASAGIRNRQPVKRLALKIVAKTGKAATVWLPPATRQKLRKKLYGVAGSDMLVVPHLQETFKRTVRQDVRVDAAKLTTPTLLIHARKDAAVPLADARLLAGLIPGAELKVIDDSDHFVHLTSAAEIEKYIEEFLK